MDMAHELETVFFCYFILKIFNLVNHEFLDTAAVDTNYMVMVMGIDLVFKFAGTYTYIQFAYKVVF